MYIYVYIYIYTYASVYMYVYIYMYTYLFISRVITHIDIYIERERYPSVYINTCRERGRDVHVHGRPGNAGPRTIRVTRAVLQSG